MNSYLIIENNKEVTIKSIKQWHTYGGLLEGIPNDKMNARIIERTKIEAKEFSHMEEIYLIEPKEMPIDYDGKYPFGNPAALPGVTCVAELWHNDVFRDTNKMFSSLCIIWFQEDYAFPIDEEIVKAIKEIPFSKICGEFDY
ncbi:hypothetical protein FIA58_009910 [Flavobacterium jejuense]|uniref:Nudix hydrolase domain-containing protein n=1 Tax=Flavobacterium jejuense TaxID=1544455 RepID=A0ABX0IQK8_9FLAO|nr:hypothetical protein [Flavobacterium jejuense]NHN25988.1 hypothetical protein [Flavobacterium jejuense]